MSTPASYYTLFQQLEELHFTLREGLSVAAAVPCRVKHNLISALICDSPKLKVLTCGSRLYAVEEFVPSKIPFFVLAPTLQFSTPKLCNIDLEVGGKLATDLREVPNFGTLKQLELSACYNIDLASSPSRADSGNGRCGGLKNWLYSLAVEKRPQLPSQRSWDLSKVWIPCSSIDARWTYSLLAASSSTQKPSSVSPWT